jgi:hypothetical protein
MKSRSRDVALSHSIGSVNAKGEGRIGRRYPSILRDLSYKMHQYRLQRMIILLEIRGELVSMGQREAIRSILKALGPYVPLTAMVWKVLLCST